MLLGDVCLWIRLARGEYVPSIGYILTTGQSDPKTYITQQHVVHSITGKNLERFWECLPLSFMKRGATAALAKAHMLRYGNPPKMLSDTLFQKGK